MRILTFEPTHVVPYDVTMWRYIIVPRVMYYCNSIFFTSPLNLKGGGGLEDTSTESGHFHGTPSVAVIIVGFHIIVFLHAYSGLDQHLW